MGTYVYGVSSRSRKVKGFDEPVYELVFIDKPSYSIFHDEFSREGAMTMGRMNAKPSMKGKLVSYDVNNKDVAAVIIFRYKLTDNVFYDGNEERVMETVGYAKWVGNRLVKIDKEEHEAVLRAEEEEAAKYAF
jgi:hypothetical protein